MAFVGDDNKLLNQNQAQGQGQGDQQPSQQNQGQGSGQSSGGGGQVSGQPQTGNLSSSSSGDVSGGSGSAPGAAASTSSGQQAGQGGVGGWTNIQSYMNANQGDTGSAQNLKNSVDPQFAQEKSSLDSQASTAKSQAQSAANQEASADSSASQWIGDAAKNYNYSGPQNNAYNQDVQQTQSALNGKYSGPTSFNFALSDGTQKLGQNIGNDQSFNQYMGNLAQQRAGGPLSDGGRSLQSQLDVNNQALANTRQDLLQQYAGLGSYRDQAVADTNSAAGQAQQDYANHQDHIRNYLSNDQSAQETGLKNASSDARNNYSNEFNGGSGLSSTLYDHLTANSGGADGATNQAVANAAIAGRRNAGIWGNNLSYNQLQNEQTALPVSPHNAVEYNGGLANNLAALNNFYSTEDQKYANTGDAQKREWNSIQDVLGSTASKQAEGFKVRG
jgi:hypothetical protein